MHEVNRILHSHARRTGQCEFALTGIERHDRGEGRECQRLVQRGHPHAGAGMWEAIRSLHLLSRVLIGIQLPKSMQVASFRLHLL